MTEQTSNPRLLATLRDRLQGQVIAPSDAQYETARRGWNAAVGGHRSAMAVCADGEDVRLAL